MDYTMMRWSTVHTAEIKENISQLNVNSYFNFYTATINNLEITCASQKYY